MYILAKRLLPALGRRNSHFLSSSSGVRALADFINPPRFTTSAASETVPSQNPLNSDSFASSSSTVRSEEERSRAHDETQRSRSPTRPKAHWQEEQARVLHASLRHVVRFPFFLLTMDRFLNFMYLHAYLCEQLCS